MTTTIKNNPAKNIDDYISGFPADVQKMLQQVRAAIRKAVPAAEETIKYAIPTFTFHGNLVSFGAWKTHIGFYPAPREAAEFKKELSIYEGAKATVQFPFGKPIPTALIGRMAKFNASRMLEKAAAKSKKKK